MPTDRWMVCRQWAGNKAVVTMNFNPGDIVRTALHRDSPRADFAVIRTKPDGRIVVRCRSGRMMSLLPHQLCLVRAVRGADAVVKAKGA